MDNSTFIKFNANNSACFMIFVLDLWWQPCVAFCTQVLSKFALFVFFCRWMGYVSGLNAAHAALRARNYDNYENQKRRIFGVALP